MVDYRAIEVADTQAQSGARRFDPDDSVALHRQSRDWLADRLAQARGVTVCRRPASNLPPCSHHCREGSPRRLRAGDVGEDPGLRSERKEAGQRGLQS
jgi:hypothetical protein